MEAFAVATSASLVCKLASSSIIKSSELNLFILWLRKREATASSFYQAFSEIQGQKEWI